MYLKFSSCFSINSCLDNFIRAKEKLKKALNASSSVEHLNSEVDENKRKQKRRLLALKQNVEIKSKSQNKKRAVFSSSVPVLSNHPFTNKGIYETMPFK